MPDYSIPSGKRKHFRKNPLSFHFFLPLFTLWKLIYIPHHKEIHHIYKISIPKISKHTFIPAKISTFRTAKMGCLSKPHLRYFSLIYGHFALTFTPRCSFVSNYIFWYLHHFSLHLYYISCEQSDCLHMVDQ